MTRTTDMRNQFRIASLAALSALLAAIASAQIGMGWTFQCIEPDPEDEEGPYAGVYSDDYAVMPGINPFNPFQGLGNALIQARIGISGTVDWGGDRNGNDFAEFCYPEARTLDAAGRLAFWVGSVGSVQSDLDNNMALTVGAPTDPVGDFTFARILKGAAGDSVLFGDGGLTGSFQGASNRYFTATWADGDVNAELLLRVVGDAIVLRWRLTNLLAESQPLGLLFGCYPGMFASEGRSDPADGTNQSNSLLTTQDGNQKFIQGPSAGKYWIGWNTMPVGRPIMNERLYTAANPKFPDFLKFQFGQANPYGIRVDNRPPEGMRFFDPRPGVRTEYRPTTADLIVIGDQGGMSETGILFENEMRLSVFGDPTGTLEESDTIIPEMAFIQRFPVATVAPGSFRDVVHVIRQPWSVGDYSDPYALVLDAPRVIAPNPTGPNGFQQDEYTIRAWVDNQYDVMGTELMQRSFTLTLTLPSGFSLAPGETAVKTINNVPPNQLAYVDWRVIPGINTSGRVSYTVRSVAVPGGTKTVTGSIIVAPTRVVRLAQGPNMVTLPYNFDDSSLDSIFGLQAGVDYVAYKWSPELFTYVPTTSVERGRGYWIVPATDLGFRAIQGATEPTDTALGGLLVTLNQGWNLIGNPYNYPVPVSQLVGVPEEAPEVAMSWADLVSAGFVTSSLAWYDQEARMYRFTSGLDAMLEPHRAYWVFVSTFRPLRLSWPGVFLDGFPNAGRSVEDPFRQNDRQWRLQLTARSQDAVDSGLFIGVVNGQSAINQWRMPKPPMAPGQTLEISVMDDYDGQPTRAAKAFTDKLVRTEWNLQVQNKQAGEVTLTWPTLAAVPRNVRLRIVDPVAGVTRDLRASSGYTFTMSEPGTRELTLVMEPGGSAKPIIGNVLVTRSGRDVNGPVTISYALSGDALVTVRVLSATGREVFTVQRGRSDSMGQNSVTWSLRDNANRAVAPGTYRIEILAETPSGERVRRVVPVNVVR